MLRSNIAVLLLAGALSGCAGSTTAVLDSLRYAVQSSSATPRMTLNPDFRYLRATVDGRTILLVLGYVEEDPQGRVEVWYSAEREVLRLQNGRIVGAVGLATEWRSVRLSESPKWSSMTDPTTSNRLTRSRDVMPGYRFGVQDILILKQVQPPARSSLVDLDPKSLLWFEESVVPASGSTHADEDSTIPSRYAVSVKGNEETVVYGEQCISRTMCLAWQRWPTAPSKGKEDR